MLMPDDRARLGQERWLAGLAPARRAGILGALTPQTLAPGDHIYRLGDPPNGIHAILAGKVRLSSYTAAGREIAALIAPPFWLGELSVIDGLERPNDALAETAVRLATLTMPAIAALTAADPGLWRDIARLGCLHQRLVMTNAALVQARSTLQLLVETLLRQSADDPDGTVRATQDQLARLVGLSRQRTNTLLGDLARRGLVRRAYRGVTVDRPALRRFAETLQNDLAAG